MGRAQRLKPAVVIFKTRSRVELEVVPPLVGRQSWIRKQYLAHPVRVLDGDRSPLAELARVVVELRESEDVFGHLQRVCCKGGQIATVHSRVPSERLGRPLVKPYTAG